MTVPAISHGPTDVPSGGPRVAPADVAPVWMRRSRRHYRRIWFASLPAEQTRLRFLETWLMPAGASTLVPGFWLSIHQAAIVWKGVRRMRIMRGFDESAAPAMTPSIALLLKRLQRELNVTEHPLVRLSGLAAGECGPRFCAS